jgi:hypothetical protein
VTLDRDGLLACGGRYAETYISTNGGLSWVKFGTGLAGGPWPVRPEQEDAWSYPIPNSEVHYRFVPGRRIERSGDGGTTWDTDLSMRMIVAQEVAQPPGQAYFSVQAARAPYGAEFDSASGHLILAMGLEGTLVRRDATGSLPAEEAWQWVAVGRYTYHPVVPARAWIDFLRGELWLAVGVGFLMIAFGAWRALSRQVRSITVFWGVVLLAALLGSRLALPGDLDGLFDGLKVCGAGVGGLILGLIAVNRSWDDDVPDRWGALPRLAAGALAAGVLFFTPMVLWALGVLPTYTVAAILASVLAAGAWGTGIALQVLWHSDQ